MTRTKMYRATTKLILQPAPQLSQNQFDMMMSWWQMDRFIADQIEVLEDPPARPAAGRPARPRQSLPEFAERRCGRRWCSA